MADHRTALDKLHQQRKAAAATRAVVGGVAGPQEVSGSQNLEMRHAVFHVISEDNGLGLDQKQSETEPGQPSLDDPVEFGSGAWANPLGRLKWYIGKIRRDVLRWKDGRVHRTSIGFHKDAVDELFDGDGKPMPLGAEYLTPGVDSSLDSDEQPVFIYTRSGFRILVPLYAEGGIVGASAGGTSQQLWDGTGMYFAQMQNDGDTFNFVAYKASSPFSIGNPDAVIFSMQDILTRIKQLEQRP